MSRCVTKAPFPAKLDWVAFVVYHYLKTLKALKKRFGKTLSSSRFAIGFIVHALRENIIPISRGFLRPKRQLRIANMHSLLMCFHSLSLPS